MKKTEKGGKITNKKIQDLRAVNVGINSKLFTKKV